MQLHPACYLACVVVSQHLDSGISRLRRRSFGVYESYDQSLPVVPLQKALGVVSGAHVTRSLSLSARVNGFPELLQ